MYNIEYLEETLGKLRELSHLGENYWNSLKGQVVKHIKFGQGKIVDFEFRGSDIPIVIVSFNRGGNNFEKEFQILTLAEHYFKLSGRAKALIAEFLNAHKAKLEIQSWKDSHKFINYDI